MTAAAPVPHAAADAGDARSITRLYVVALAVIAALSIAGQLLVQRQLRQQRADATVINVAGRQRMLSQRLCKCVLLLAAADAADVDRKRIRDELTTLLSQWHRSHRGLQNGDAASGLPGKLSPDVAATFARIEPAFAAMHEAATRVAASPTGAESDAAVVLANEGEFLDGMDAIVYQLESEAQARVERLRAIELTLLLCTLLALACEGVFIFRPAVRRIRTTIDALRSTGRDLREARDAAEAANRAKSQFLANVSHELRTPLHAVRGATELLLANSTASGDQEYVQIIDEASESLAALVEDLLDLSQIEVEGLKLTSQPFKLSDTLRRCVLIVDPLARQKGLRVRLVAAADLPTFVLGDEFRIQQILLNLLNNAVKFTETGGITLHVATVDDSTRPLGVDPNKSSVVRFEVVDTGIGIAATQLEAIFEKFYQVDESSPRRAGGVGLGLSISYRLVNLMHGRLRVDSVLGQGSTFWFELALPHAAAPVERTVDPQLDVRPLRILAADDTDHSRRILSAILASLGHTATVVADGRSAFERFCTDRFDLVLLDGQMPEWDGERTAEAIRAYEQEVRAPRTPLIMLTADATRRENLPVSFDDYLIKPTSRATLQAMIAQYADAAAATSAAEADASADGALNRLGGDVALFDALREAFFAGLPEQMAALQAAVDVGSPHVSVIAHRLRGQLATFDFHEAQAAAAALETNAANATSVVTAYEQLVASLRALGENRTGCRSDSG